MGNRRGLIDEPNMSDATILVNVEDLINMAMGPVNKNTVNFKLIQAVLHILARQMRMLETNVEIRRRKSPRKKIHGQSADESSGSKRKEKSEKAKTGKVLSLISNSSKLDSTENVEVDGCRSQKQRGKDKVLVDQLSFLLRYYERGPRASLRRFCAVLASQPHSKTKVGSIEVVTQSQFAQLEAAINELKSIAGPIPIPELPDNQKLRSDLAKGSASLTDTMQAMQVTARLKAAEEAIGRMAGLLTALSAAGALPEDLLDKFGTRFDDDIGTDMAVDAMVYSPTRSEPSRKSLAAKSTMAAPSKVGSMISRPSLVSKQSAVSTGVIALVTHEDMDDALLQLKDDLTKNLNNMATKSAVAADTALNTSKAVAERMDIALKLNTRISTLNSMVSDYAEQLSGFDAGLSTQMMSFQEQMAQMRTDLKGGLTQLEQANNNAETTAIMELNERYEELVSELDRTTFAHQGLTIHQKQLSDELHSLVECVETLREQKADRDEVLDGLRDKANNSRLAGLLTEVDFAVAREEIDRRLEVCYDKFKRQEAVWMLALNDLKHVAETKAEFMQLLATKEDTQQELQELHELLRQLTVLLGEPKAAILTRQLAKDASCGVCLVPALMEPLDANHGAPPPLPAMRRPSPAGAPPQETPCLEEWSPPQPPDTREHACRRWVGGSHTLISEGVKREQATPMPVQTIPTRKYTGYGSDGRLYQLEEDLQPCIECNVLKPVLEPEAEEHISASHVALLSEEGAGDQGQMQPLCPCDTECFCERDQSV
ncbi:hypothetical protein K1T71_008089 [Dendrolimus kikuchii]|uniref:Uncharacterized protein n=1 Tax=Dendrolimus kikuchii TaxID=765133 RepID=A0ACC1CWI0_9NEOP|nr:hypothetical protein K1T71_008089 [Dendrolimus kikuchii]